MKNSNRLVCVLLAGVIFAAPEVKSQDRKKSFEEFRKEILSGYSDFRKTILERYADFLNGEWHEYESLNGERRDRTPKPRSVPKADRPDLTPGRPSDHKPVTVKPAGVNLSGDHVLKPGTDTEPTSSRPAGRRGKFDYYGLPVSFPDIDFNIAYRLSSPSDYASQWKDLAKSGVSKQLVPAIKETAAEMGLNDYLVYELVKAYVDSKFPQADPSSRLSTVHFLLVNLGYDARVAMTGTGAPLLLLPFKQKIYARNYMMMPDGKYYVFAPDGFDYNRLGKEGIRTCTLPGDGDKGEKFDLRLGELNIPKKPKKFEYEYEGLKLTGEVNENLMPILYHYPQMPISDYALSTPDPALRKDLVNQIKVQLGNLEGDRGVATLLGFMHNVFDYATDEEFHGFEKPYFLEETLYYPKNDCEDRAIFYTYFLWNALGKEAQLISFPGHEAATVRLENEVEGKSYEFKGKRYYISDPTFIGSKTGMVMPIYVNEKPKVDYTFSKSANND